MNVIGQITAIVFITYHRRVLGLRQSLLIQLALLVFAFIVWWQQWPWSDEIAVLLLLTCVVLAFIYWFERRRGYTFFQADRTKQKAVDGSEMLMEKRYTARITGLLATEERQDYVFLRPGQLWRLPRGDIGLMASRAGKAFLYDFILPGTVAKLENGHLLFGPQPLPTLAIHLDSTWGPEFTQYDQTYVAGMPRDLPPLRKVLYLTFESEDDLLPVWRSIEKQTGPQAT